MGDSDAITVRIETALANVDAAQWDVCARPGPKGPTAQRPDNPFLHHAFLTALEESGCVSARNGWLPHHLIAEDGAGGIAACAPCYVKGHSRGEYVFDHGWADAYERAGGHYYPKLQVAVPFTPVPGRRLLVREGLDEARMRKALTGAVMQVTDRLDLSSAHVTFLDEREYQLLGADGLLQRTGQQFHWTNQGYDSFDAFLDALASRKRKAIRRERREALDGVSVEWRTGKEIGEDDWDRFFAFYMDTGSRKWGTPYLNRTFFSLLGERMSDHVALAFARRGGTVIAGALNMIGSDTLYGRYWGCSEWQPFLHFELCYYQAVEFAIAHGLKRVEAGAQGEHKLVRGYEPQTTYSVHYIRDARFREAVAAFLDRERRQVAHEQEVLADYTPYRRHARSDRAALNQDQGVPPGRDQQIQDKPERDDHE